MGVGHVHLEIVHGADLFEKLCDVDLASRVTMSVPTYKAQPTV